MVGNWFKCIFGEIIKFLGLRQLYFFYNDILIIEECDMVGLRFLELLDLNNNLIEYVLKIVFKDVYILN